MVSCIMSMACICICMIIYTVFSMYHIGIGIGTSSSHPMYMWVYCIIYRDRPCPECWPVCGMGGWFRGERRDQGVGVCCCWYALVSLVGSCE